MQDGLVNFNKKFKEKSGLSWEDRGKTPKNGKYVFIERSYEPDSDKEDDEEEDAVPSGSKEGRSRSTSPAKSSLAPPVKSLMELIFNQQYVKCFDNARSLLTIVGSWTMLWPTSTTTPQSFLWAS